MKNTNKGKKRITYWEMSPFPRKRVRYEQRESISQRLTPICILLGMSLATLYIRHFFSNYTSDFSIRATEITDEGVANNANAGQNSDPAITTTAPSPSPSPSPSPTPKTAEEQIIDYIYEVFGSDGKTMVQVFTCESGLKPDRVGDTHLMGMLNGEMVGDSIGIAQIRTGDAGVYDSTPWNRAKANGMTADEFRQWLKNPKNNIDYAKKIYDRQGIYAWANCYYKVKGGNYDRTR